VDKFYDPFGWFWRWLKRRQDRATFGPSRTGSKPTAARQS
jgi:hypothetical protein